MANIANAVKNIAENYYRLSRVHERYRWQTDGRQHIANMNNRTLSSHPLKPTQS